MKLTNTEKVKAGELVSTEYFFPETTTATPVEFRNITLDNNQSANVIMHVITKRTDAAQSTAFNFYGKIQRSSVGVYLTQTATQVNIGTISPGPVLAYAVGGAGITLTVASGSAMTVRWTIELKIIKTNPVV